MKLVATWNVNGVRARLPRIIEWLDARGPDIACLQELKADDDNFPYDEIARAGYTAVANCQKGWNGVAVLARGTGSGTANLIEAGLPGEEDFGARVVSAEVDGLAVISVYVPNGKDVDHADYPAKIRWLGALTDYIGASFPADSPALIGGDFNVVASDIDSFDPPGLAGTIFHTDAERAALDGITNLGYSDLFRALDPETPGFSWWDYRGGNFHKNLGLRIDLLFGSAPVVEKTRKVWVDRDFRKGQKPSDHAPVMAQIDL